MLLFVAIQHALLSARMERVDDRVIAAGAGIVTLASGNLAIGFGVGVAMVLVRWLPNAGRDAGAGTRLVAMLSWSLSPEQ